MGKWKVVGGSVGRWLAVLIKPSIFREQPVKQKATRPPPKNRRTLFAEYETKSDQVLSSSLHHQKKNHLSLMSKKRLKLKD